MFSTDLADGIALSLNRSMFTPVRATLVETEQFRVQVWSNDNAIQMLGIENEAGHVTVLPFVGQQVWDAHFHGRRLTMASAFDEPVATTDYLANNGAYLIHCGGSAMGNPGPGDSHPLHGELPNATLDTAALRWTPADAGEPETLTIGGELTYRRAFGPWFSARLELMLTAGSGIMDSTVQLENCSAEPRPLMYLAHLNFRPAIGGNVEETLQPGRQIRTRGAGEWAGLSPAEMLEPGRLITPEVVQTVPLQTNDSGWRLSQQVHADGSRDLVEHRDPLTHTIRWLRRSGDEDAFAFAMPATAEPDGYASQQRQGNVVSYPPAGRLTAHFRHGALGPNEPMSKGHQHD